MSISVEQVDLSFLEEEKPKEEKKLERIEEKKAESPKSPLGFSFSLDSVLIVLEDTGFLSVSREQIIERAKAKLEEISRRIDELKGELEKLEEKKKHYEIFLSNIGGTINE